MKPKKLTTLIALFCLVLSFSFGCESVSKERYNALRDSFASYVEADSKKLESVELNIQNQSDFISNQLNLLPEKSEEPFDEEKFKENCSARKTVLMLQKASMKTWKRRNKKARAFIKKAEVTP